MELDQIKQTHRKKREAGHKKDKHKKKDHKDRIDIAERKPTDRTTEKSQDAGKKSIKTVKRHSKDQVKQVKRDEKRVKQIKQSKGDLSRASKSAFDDKSGFSHDFSRKQPSSSGSISDSESSSSFEDDLSDMQSKEQLRPNKLISESVDVHDDKRLQPFKEAITNKQLGKKRQASQQASVCNSPKGTRPELVEFKQNPIIKQQVTPSKMNTNYSLKDFLDSYKEFKLLDKIVPDPIYSEGCYVQVPHSAQPIQNDIGQIKSFCKEDQKLDVALFKEHQNISIKIDQCKFLARAYSAAISDIETNKFNSSFQSYLEKGFNSDESLRKGKQVVLIQVLYTIDQPITAESFQTGSSVHRLHLLEPTCEPSNVQGTSLLGHFKLHPVVFKKEKRGGVIKTEINFRELNLKSYCYKNQATTEFILQAAKTISDAYKQNYLKKTQDVVVTKQDATDCLFSLCTFVENSVYEQIQARTSFKLLNTTQKAKLGILVKVKPNSDDSEFLLAFKLIAQRANQREKMIWIDLNTHKVFADLSLGYVQQQWLQQHETFEQNNILKLKHLKMLSRLESQKEKSLYYNTNEEETGIVAPFIQGVGDLKEEICKKCNYKVCIKSVRYLECSICQNHYHEKCLKKNQQKIGESEQKWRCPDCLRCSTCLSQKNKDCLLNCKKCNKSIHYDCVDINYKLRIKVLELDKSKANQSGCMLPQFFKCEKCITCFNCGRKDSGIKKQNKWSKDFKYCSNCNKKREQKLYCPVCEKIFDSDPNQLSLKEGEDKTMQAEDLKMLKCGLCQMWVHYNCDRMLAESEIRDRFLITGPMEEGTSKNIPFVYSCKDCRQRTRCNFLDQLTDILIAEDKKQEFVYPFWQYSNLQSVYLNVIKRPICFSMIKTDIQQSKKYLIQCDSYKADIERIFINAKNFNALSSDIHKLASKLHDKCMQILNQARLWEIIQLNSQATNDEERFAAWVKKVNKEKRNIQEPTDFKLKPKELFQNQEQLDIRTFGVSIAQLQSAYQSQQITIVADMVTPVVHQQQLELANRRLIVQNFTNCQDLNQKNAALKSGIVSSQLVNQFQNNKLQNQNALTQSFSQANSPSQLLEQANLTPKEKWNQLMNELRLNEDRDTCWYSNPVRISFDKPELIFEQMCYLCGAFGNKEDFLNCNLCAESFHPYCLPHPKDEKNKIQGHWLCYNCIFCQECHSSKQWEGLLICVVCDKVYHFWCLEPQLIYIPECNWKCPDCFKCRLCGTESFFSQEEIENQVNFDPNEKYANFLDFELCYKCGQDEWRKSFCSICEEKTTLGLNQLQKNLDTAKRNNQEIQLSKTSEKSCHEIDLFQCQSCKFFSHLSCSRTSVDQLQQLVKLQNNSEDDVQKVYQCFDCLMHDKLPSFLAREQCLTYSNLHNMSKRTEQLNFLCTSILGQFIPDQYKNYTGLFIENFVNQNKMFFRVDEIMTKWFLLLQSDADPALETIQQQLTEVQNDNNSEQYDMPRSSTEQTNLSDFELSDLYPEQVRHSPSINNPEPYSNTFIPAQRNLYTSLRQNQQPETIEQIDFMDLVTCPTEQNLAQVDKTRSYVEIEFKAVMKLKLHFFKWFENLVGNTLMHQSLFDQQSNTQRALENQEEMEFDQHEQTASKTHNRDKPEEEPLEFCTEDDVLIDNPQKWLTCVLCGQNGEMKVTGRLIPYSINQFVHVNCAMWTNEVKEGQDEGVVSSELYNFHFAFSMYKNQICSICSKPKATLICSNKFIKKCPHAYHFPCAYKSKKVSFMTSMEIYCEFCTPKTQEAIVGLPIEFKTYPKRRIVIVKNIKPQCTNAFDSMFKGEQNQVSPIEQQHSNQNEQDEEVVIQCNKWRPYYYDTFNRAGNLTVLSLSKKRNAIIENLHTYKYKSNTWHDRLKRKFPEEQFTDYASIRIFWDHKGKKTQYGLPQDKSYFLFQGDFVFEVKKNDMCAILPFVSKRIKENLLSDLKIETKTQPSINQQSLDEFWNSHIENLRQRYNKFCQENTYMTVQMQMGLEKFPILYWNNPGEKLGLEMLDINVASFFYKSAHRVLEMFNKQGSFFDEGGKTSKNQALQFEEHKSQIPTSGLQSNKVQDAVQNEKKQPHNVSLDSIFKQMLKTNLMSEDDDAHMIIDAQGEFQMARKHVSARNMNYEQIMACLGKKTIAVRKLERRQQEAAQYDSDGNGDQGQDQGELAVDKQVSTADKNKSRNKSALEPSDLVAKGNDINTAMKYRASKERPKLVEVCTSQIHRNGLFASQPLNPKDIVIEYVGEKIRIPVADRREKLYEKLGVGDCYLFSLDKDYIIDATFFGNKARYINHSCDPNLKSEKITVNNETHIIFVAIKPIQEGEELTFDYQFDYEAEKIECFCGSALCKGRLN